MKIETVIKFKNDSYEDFDFNVNKTVSYLTVQRNQLIVDVNVIFDGKQVIAIIKYK